MDLKRYIVHDFLIGNPVLIDCKEKTMTFYNHNIYGQIYDLKTANCHTISPQMIKGLIRRTGNPEYGIMKSKAIDGYTYAYLMTSEQRAHCRRKPHIFGWDEKIVNTDDYTRAIRKMCEWVYENQYPNSLGDKEAERGNRLKYCEDFLAGKQPESLFSRQKTSENAQTITSPHKKNDRGDR